MPKSEFKFELSLSILNHLGRNLYRSFTTVLGEAISNAWDADAEKVHIHIDKDNNTFFIKDDGTGMDKKDFQEKFLKIGYSKRGLGVTKTPKDRPIIGRKGIGKLALLSCANTITVISKKDGGEYVGGKIDNSGLDAAIKDDLNPSDYPLGDWKDEEFFQHMTNHSHGTIIKFENIKDGIRNRLPFLKKIIALYFRFSLSDKSFSIYVNDEEVTLDALSELAKDTQFIWNINNFQDPYISQHLKDLKQTETIKMEKEVEGFIASVEKPRDLNIEGMEERVSVDLFVNGRLREKDILRHLPIVQHIKNYLYGQIHFNDLDEGEDKFTSSRESVFADDPEYKKFLKQLQEKVSEIMTKWDTLRGEHRYDGYSEGERFVAKVQRKTREIFNLFFRNYFPSGYSKTVANDLQKEAEYNLPSYVECFISENLLRGYIRDKGLTPKFCKKGGCEKAVKDRNKWCAYCKGLDNQERAACNKRDAKLSYDIRENEEDILTYLDHADLVRIIGGKKTFKKNEGHEYKIIRNAIMHTSLLTEQAKNKLTSIFDNIWATITNLGTKSK